MGLGLDRRNMLLAFRFLFFIGLASFFFILVVGGCPG